MRLGLFILALVIAASGAAAQTCGSADDPCETENGAYHMRLPAPSGGAAPVLVFFHGHRSSGAMIHRSAGLTRSFVEAGFVVLAPNGVPISGARSFAWPSRDRGPEARDDVAFVREVLADAARHVSIDPARIYAAGFSAGGSMVWQLACYDAERYAGFAALAGTLRRPQATPTCPEGPVRLLHIHGYRDNQVPFEGRAIANWHQGDLWESFGHLRSRNGCRTHPDSIDSEGPFWCRDWRQSCESGALSLCVHPGGHGLPQGWTDLAREFFDSP